MDLFGRQRREEEARKEAQRILSALPTEEELRQQEDERMIRNIVEALRRARKAGLI